MKYNDRNKPLQCFMTQSTCYQGTGKMVVKGVLWHSTGANNPTLKRYVQPDDNAPNRGGASCLLGKNTYGNDWNHIYRKAGLNCWIGQTGRRYYHHDSDYAVGLQTLGLREAEAKALAIAAGFSSRFARTVLPTRHTSRRCMMKREITAYLLQDVRY